MKNLLFTLIVLSLFVGCGQKPIVVRGKLDRPQVTSKGKQHQILGTSVNGNNPLNNPELIPGAVVETIERNVTNETNETNLTNPSVLQPNLGTEIEQTPVTLEAGDEAVMDPTISQSYVATLKTKRFAYADAAFMHEENGVIDLQVLSAGKPLVTLKISSDVCVDHNCISKEEFNQDYLSPAYPPELINQVLTKQPIFDGKNLKRISGGFMQKITTPDYAIRYKTTPGSIYFKDTKNHLTIKLRRLK